MVEQDIKKQKEIIKKLDAYKFSTVRIYKICSILEEEEYSYNNSVILDTDNEEEETNIYAIRNNIIFLKNIKKKLTIEDFLYYYDEDILPYTFYQYQDEVRILMIDENEIYKYIYYIPGTLIVNSFEFLYPFFGLEPIKYTIHLIDNKGKPREFLPEKELKKKSKYPKWNPKLPYKIEMIDGEMKLIIDKNIDIKQCPVDVKEEIERESEDEGLVIVIK